MSRPKRLAAVLALAGVAAIVPLASAAPAGTLQCAGQGTLGGGTFTLTADGSLCLAGPAGTAPLVNSLGVQRLVTHEMGHNWNMQVSAVPGGDAVTVDIVRLPDNMSITFAAPPSSTGGGATSAAGSAPAACTLSGANGEVQTTGDGVFCLRRRRKQVDATKVVQALLLAAVTDPYFADNANAGTMVDGQVRVSAHSGNLIGNHKDVMELAIQFTANDGTTSSATVDLLPAVQ